MGDSVLDLESTLLYLVEENHRLRSRIEELRLLLSRYDHPAKDSSNSSIPPSLQSISAQAAQRKEAKNRSLREPSGLPCGGQVGHKGSCLAFHPSADSTVLHQCDFCQKCGSSLSQVSGRHVEMRQSQDLPLPVRLEAINHIAVEKMCTCGHCNRGEFPATVKKGVSYGPNLHAVVGYLSTLQYIPFKRMKQILHDFFSVNLSEGTIASMLNRMRKQSTPAYEQLLDVIKDSQSVGADETGVWVNGELHWMWVFQTEAVTYVFLDPSRGKQAVDKQLPEGLPKSILTTDRKGTYFNMNVEGHQLCLAHLLRDLKYLNELDVSQQWSRKLQELFRESIHSKKTKPLQEIDKEGIKKRIKALLEEDISHLDHKFKVLQQSLIKYEQYLFNFLEREEVPYDNNASERAIRPLKVKQKVSGMFKTNQGGETFCQLHSIAHTARKNNQSAFLAMVAVANNC